MSTRAYPAPPTPCASDVAAGDLVFGSDRLGVEDGMVGKGGVEAETAHIKATVFLVADRRSAAS